MTIRDNRQTDIRAASDTPPETTTTSGAADTDVLQMRGLDDAATIDTGSPECSGPADAKMESRPSPPTPTSLADALRLAELHSLLPARDIVEARSAIALVARVTQQAADRLPCEPAALRPLIAKVLPARYRVTTKRWSNARSAVKKLLQAFGLHACTRRPKLPTSSPWAALVECLPAGAVRSGFASFARWADSAGISPDETTNATLVAYGAWRASNTLSGHIPEIVSTVRQTWNRAVRDGLPGWPRHTIVAAPLPHVDALPIEKLAPEFQADLQRYLSRRERPSAFARNDEPKLRPATAKAHRAGLIRAASLTASRLGGVGHVRSLADVVTPDAFQHVLLHIYERSGQVWRGHAANMAGILLTVARDYVGAPAEQLQELVDLRQAITSQIRKQRRPGLSERVSAKLAEFDDPVIRRKFFELPFKLYPVADKMLAKTPVRAAQLHERALGLHIMQIDPMRRYNLTAIDLERHVIKDNRGRAHTLRIFDGIKNGIPIDTALPASVINRLTRHVTTFRHHIRGSDGPMLFPSPNGGMRSPGSLSRVIAELVCHQLGIRFSLHIVRHLMATMAYEADPRNGLVAQRVLRHTSKRTTDQMYGVRRNRGANLLWQGMVEKEVKRLRGPKARPSKRGKPKDL